MENKALAFCRLSHWNVYITCENEKEMHQGNSAVSLLKKFDSLVSYVRNIIIDFQLNTSLQSPNGFLWDNFLYGYQHPT